MIMKFVHDQIDKISLEELFIFFISLHTTFTQKIIGSKLKVENKKF